MLMIRLARVGRKNQASFRVILTPKRSSPRGKIVEQLGTWNPRLDTASLKKDRILYWISKGAQLSPALHNILVSEGVVRGKKIAKHGKPAKSAEPAAAPEAASPVPAIESASEAVPEPKEAAKAS